MDDVEIGRCKEQQGRAELLRKFTSQIERGAAEVCVSKQVVEVVGEELEDEAEMVAEHETPLQLH